MSIKNHPTCKEIGRFYLIGLQNKNNAEPDAAIQAEQSILIPRNDNFIIGIMIDSNAMSFSSYIQKLNEKRKAEESSGLQEPDAKKANTQIDDASPAINEKTNNINQKQMNGTESALSSTNADQDLFEKIFGESCSKPPTRTGSFSKDPRLEKRDPRSKSTFPINDKNNSNIYSNNEQQQQTASNDSLIASINFKNMNINEATKLTNSILEKNDLTKDQINLLLQKLTQYQIQINNIINREVVASEKSNDEKNCKEKNTQRHCEMNLYNVTEISSKKNLSELPPSTEWQGDSKEAFEKLIQMHKIQRERPTFAKWNFKNDNWILNENSFKISFNPYPTDQ
jgi:hypothetical protein